jgi:hypothetical protein
MSHIALYHGLGKYIHRSLIFNMDATQYFIESDNGTVVVHVRRAGDKKPVERRREAAVDVFVKEIMLTAADGSRSKSLYVVASNNYEKERCEIFEVPYLSENADMGYLAICQSRSGCPALYSWMYETWVPQFIESQRDKKRRSSTCSSCLPINHSVPIEAAADSAEEDADTGKENAMFTLDGENTQIRLFLGDSTLGKIYADENIAIIKSAAACTSKFQAIDAGEDIRGKKGVLRGISGFEDHSVQPAFLETVNNILINYTDLSKPKRDLIISGLSRIVYAGSKSHSNMTAAKAFVRAGLVPNEGEQALLTVEQTILRSLICTFTKEEEARFISYGPALGAQFRELGHIKDETMRNMTIPILEAATDRDHRSESYERTVWLNHNLVMQRRIEATNLVEERRIVTLNKKQALADRRSADATALIAFYRLHPESNSWQVSKDWPATRLTDALHGLVSKKATRLNPFPSKKANVIAALIPLIIEVNSQYP